MRLSLIAAALMTGCVVLPLTGYAADTIPYGTAPGNPNSSQPYGTAPTNPNAVPPDGLAPSVKGYAPAHHPKDFVMETARRECSDQLTANADPDKPGSDKPDQADMNSCMRAKGFNPTAAMPHPHPQPDAPPPDPMLVPHPY